MVQKSRLENSFLTTWFFAFPLVVLMFYIPPEQLITPVAIPASKVAHNMRQIHKLTIVLFIDFAWRDTKWI